MQQLISAGSACEFMFTFCFCGNLISNNNEKVCHEISHTCWYKYPVKYQHFVEFIILHSQQQFYLTGFKITHCSYHTFKKVSFIDDNKKTKNAYLFIFMRNRVICMQAVDYHSVFLLFVVAQQCSFDVHGATSIITDELNEMLKNIVDYNDNICLH